MSYCWCVRWRQRFIFFEGAESCYQLMGWDDVKYERKSSDACKRTTAPVGAEAVTFSPSSQNTKRNSQQNIWLQLNQRSLLLNSINVTFVFYSGRRTVKANMRDVFLLRPVTLWWQRLQQPQTQKWVCEPKGQTLHGLQGLFVKTLDWSFWRTQHCVIGLGTLR